MNKQEKVIIQVVEAIEAASIVLNEPIDFKILRSKKEVDIHIYRNVIYHNIFRTLRRENFSVAKIEDGLCITIL